MRLQIRILLSSSKNGKKNLDSYCFVTSICLLSLKMMLMYRKKVICKKNLPSRRSLEKKTGSGSVCQRYGSGFVPKMSRLRNTGQGGSDSRLSFIPIMCTISTDV
jgi:hypothetical protein